MASAQGGGDSKLFARVSSLFLYSYLHCNNMYSIYHCLLPVTARRRYYYVSAAMSMS